MNFDFIEIGTSNFGTLIQNCENNEKGISIEAVKYYLDWLPDKPNVIKLNKAITGDISHKDFIEIYYIPEKIILEKGLNSWFKGCNRVGEYHPLHIKHKVTNLVKKEKVELMYIGDLFKEYNVEKLNYLKIDTEGYDLNIMSGLYIYLKQINEKSYPKKIQFETNENSKPEEVTNIIKLYEEFKYKMIYRKQDTIIERDMNF